MEDIKYVITVLTVSFIIYGLVLVFSPAGNMGNFFKSIVGVSLIAVVVLTISRQKYEFNSKLAVNNAEVNVDTLVVDTLTADLSAKSVEDYILKLLKQNGCNVQSLAVFTNISDDGGISIERVEVTCKSEQAASVKNIINSLSIHCIVTESNNDGL